MRQCPIQSHVSTRLQMQTRACCHAPHPCTTSMHHIHAHGTVIPPVLSPSCCHAHTPALRMDVRRLPKVARSSRAPVAESYSSYRLTVLWPHKCGAVACTHRQTRIPGSQLPIEPCMHAQLRFPLTGVLHPGSRCLVGSSSPNEPVAAAAPAA